MEMREENKIAVKVYSVNELHKKSGLGTKLLEQALDEYQASNGKFGLPWFRRGSRKGILESSFVGWLKRKEREVLLNG